MSVEAISLALKSDLPTGQKFVLVALANYADDEWSCWPSQASLAADTSMDTRSVRRHLSGLEKAGIVHRVRRNKDNGARSSDYITINRKNIPVRQKPTGQKTQNLPDTVPEEPSVEPSPLPIGNVFADARDDLAEAFDLWNALAERMGFPVVQSRNAKRKASLKARLRDGGGLSGWRVLLEKIEASPYCRGEVNGYRATFDSVTGAAMFTKIMEGNFDDDGRKPNHAAGGKRAAADPEAARRADLEAIYDSIRPELEGRDGLDGQGGGPAGEYGNPAGAGGNEAVSGSPEIGPGAETEARDTGGIRGGNGAAVPVCADVRPADGRSENADGDLPGSAGGHSAGNLAPRHNADHGGPQISIVAEASGHSGQCVGRTGGGEAGLLAGQVVSEPVDDLDIPDFLRRAAG